MDIVWILLIIFIASMIQGMTSFGSSLFALPLLLLILDKEIVVPMLITYNLFMNIMIFRKVRKDSNIKEIIPLLIAAALFTIPGVIFLKELDPKYIKLVIGIILIITAISNGFGIKFKLKEPRKAYVPVGMISGLLNGMAGLNGPPVLLFLSNQDVDKKTFRATLTTYFLSLNFITIGILIATQVYTKTVLLNTLYYFPALVIGVMSGIYLGYKVDDRLFKKIVLVFIAIFGVVTITNVLIGW